MEGANPNSEPWYKDGLRFQCTQCGNCCSGEPGYVFVTKGDIERIAEFLGRKDEGLGEKNVYRVGRRFSLTEDKKTGDCCFLEHPPDGKRICAIHPVRPLQCRTWPFWNSNLASPASWETASHDCPGISKGPRYDVVQIHTHRTALSEEDLNRGASIKNV